MSVDDYRDREGDAEERAEEVGGGEAWDPGEGRDRTDAGVDRDRDREGDAEERTGVGGRDDDESLDDLAAEDAEPGRPTV